MRKFFSKRNILLLVALSICVGLIFTVLPNIRTLNQHSNGYAGYKIVPYTLEGKKLNLLLAESPEQWEKGLMYYRKLEGVDGMIFQFPDRSTRTFWNKNTFMDLKVYWVDKGKVIGVSHLPSIEKSKELIYITSPDIADAVIELKIR